MPAPVWALHCSYAHTHTHTTKFISPLLRDSLPTFPPACMFSRMPLTSVILHTSFRIFCPCQQGWCQSCFQTHSRCTGLTQAGKCSPHASKSSRKLNGKAKPKPDGTAPIVSLRLRNVKVSLLKLGDLRSWFINVLFGTDWVARNCRAGSSSALSSRRWPQPASPHFLVAFPMPPGEVARKPENPCPGLSLHELQWRSNVNLCHAGQRTAFP